jgi:hypothetical protein
MTAMVRPTPAGGRYVRLPPEGFAVDPGLADPTGVLAAAFAGLASPLIAGGVLRYYLVHAALPRLSEALSNLGFGRNGVYGIQPATPRRGPARAGKASGAPSSAPRSPGRPITATSGSRSTSKRLTRCLGRSGSTPGSVRPDTASCASSTVPRLLSPERSRWS